jgi:hypothetical protein
MKTRNNQKGFASLELVLILILVGVIAFAGFRVMSNKKAAKTATTTSSTTASIVVPAKLTTKADAINAGKALDQTPIDSQLNPTQLDSNIKSLL